MFPSLRNERPCVRFFRWPLRPCAPGLAASVTLQPVSESSNDGARGERAISEALSYDRRLRGAVSRRRKDCSDPELSQLLGKVEARRAARYGVLAGNVRNDDPTPTQAASRPSGPHAAAAPGGTIIAVDDVSPDVRILRVARPAGFSYRAGQHLKLGVPGADKRHNYSIASAPHEPHLEFCIELVPGGRLTPRLFSLRPGDRLELSAKAKGSFALDDSARRHLMVATVTGIAPIRSIVLDALQRKVGVDITMLHGASYADELPYREALEQLASAGRGVNYVPTVSRPRESRNAGWTGRTGRVDAVALEELRGVQASENLHAYACGHPQMVANVKSQLSGRGFGVTTEAF